MPVATQQFLAFLWPEGVVVEVDVSGWADWVTLGGTRKGDPTPSAATILLSKQRCADLYWRLHGITFSADVETEDNADPPNVDSVVVSGQTCRYGQDYDDNDGTVTDNSVAAEEPIYRPTAAGQQIGTWVRSSGKAYADAAVLEPEPLAMFDGSTFVGWGIRGRVEPRLFEVYADSVGSGPAGGIDFASGFNTAATSALATISGYPFIRRGDATFTKTDSGVTMDATLSVDSLDFWTY